MKKILIPVTFTENSDQVLRYADQLADYSKAATVLLHCAETPTLTETKQSRILQQMRSESARLLQRSGNSKTDVKHECVVRPGWLSGCVQESVKSNHIDMVVLPSDEIDSLWENQTETFSGLEQSPVLIVPPNTTFKPIKKIVFATDFADQDPTVLSKIANLVKQFDAELLLVHVYNENGFKELSAYKKAIAAMRDSLNYDKVSFHLLDEEDTLEGISEFAENAKADMLLMATQDAFLLKRLYSDTYKKTLAYHTRIPILNFYQIKNNPCSGCCSNCSSLKNSQNI